MQRKKMERFKLVYRRVLFKIKNYLNTKGGKILAVLVRYAPLAIMSGALYFKDIRNASQQAENRMKDARIFLFRNRLDSILQEKGFQDSVIRELAQDVINSAKDLDDIPRPLWYKIKRGDDFLMLYVNSSYQIQILHVKRADYIGRTDFAVHSKESSSVYNINDDYMAEHGGQKIFDEPILLKDGTTRIGAVLKWRVVEGEDIYIWGMVLYYY